MNLFKPVRQIGNEGIQVVRGGVCSWSPQPPKDNKNRVVRLVINVHEHTTTELEYGYKTTRFPNKSTVTKHA